MFENRSVRFDLLALGLFVFTLFLGLALFSYDPADPVRDAIAATPLRSILTADLIRYPVSDSLHNACGRWGAVAAYLTRSTFGVGCWYVLASLIVVDLALLRRHALDVPLVRFVGWLATVAGICTLLSILTPGIGSGPIVGSGGYVGAVGRSILEAHFAFLGGLILAASLTVGGLLLCTDYWLVRGIANLIRLVLLVAIHRRPAARQEAQGAANTPTEPGREALAVRIKGRKRDAGLQDDLRSDPKSNRRTTTAADERIAANEEFYDDEELEDELSDGEYDDDDADAKVAMGKDAADEDDEFDSDADDDATDDFDDDQDDEELDDELNDERDKAGAARMPARVGTASGRNPAENTAAPAPHFKVRRTGDGLDRDKVLAELDQASQSGPAAEYELPGIDLLIPGEDLHYEAQEKEVRRKAKILEKTFLDFGFKVRVVEIETGPVIAQYEVELEAGLRLSKITGLADDLAIALRVPSVRIVAPIPGKNTVGIEVPNEERQVVRMREVIEEANGKVKKMRIPLFLGKDVSGNPLTVDLASLPHLLIAGRTGTGKSVCLNAIISSMLMTRRPDEVRMLMIDPKMVELSGYGRLPHLMHPVVTDMKKAEAILAWAVEKMEERYALLARAGVRHICSYNQLGEAELFERLQPETDEDRKRIPLNLPFIVIVADEIADMMMQATGKEVEQHIIRLAQKSRAVGIHLILATQKPTVDVITGLIKSNLPARISFQVASRTDSRVVLDEMGADKLLGNGDMLFLWPGTSTLLRGQGTYLSDDEINRVVDFCSKGQTQNFVSELVNMKVEAAGAEGGIEAIKKRDELYESAIDVVVREGRGSVSLLQRTLGVGYGRAARLIDFMAEEGIVGQYAGSQAREVLITLDDWERMQSGQKPIGGTRSAAPAAPLQAAMAPQAPTSLPPELATSRVVPERPAPPPRRSNRIIPDREPESDSDSPVAQARLEDESHELDDDEASDHVEDQDGDHDEDSEEDRAIGAA